MLIVVFSMAGSTACGQAAPTATPTPQPTDTPTATATPLPTNTPMTGGKTPVPTLSPQETTRTLQVGDLARTYILHIPPGLDSTQAQPLVFVFHGNRQDGKGVQTMTGFNAVSDRNGFIVVYPDGVDQDWNIGIPGWNTHVDDFTFLRQVIADLGSIARVDPKRIYATGFSAGAFFSYRLACEMSDTFAAVAPVEGIMLTDPCQPGQPVAVLHVNGTNDPAVPYEGSTVSLAENGALVEVIYPPVEQIIATWVKLDGCNSTAQMETLQKGAVTHMTYSGCKAGTAVELYLIKFGGHSWPDLYGFSSINSQTIWDFLQAHPKP